MGKDEKGNEEKMKLMMYNEGKMVGEKGVLKE